MSTETAVDEVGFIKAFSSPRERRDTCKSAVCRVLNEVTPEMADSLRAALANRYDLSTNPTGWSNRDIAKELVGYGYKASESSVKQYRLTGCACSRRNQ